MIEESDKKSISDVMAEIGGYLGLFVGISLVTVLEFALFILSMIFDATAAKFCSKAKKGGRTTPIGEADAGDEAKGE